MAFIIGLDESGKGDYFGPLVAAAVALSGEAISELAALGLKDSKRHSKNRVEEFASLIKSSYPVEIVLITPQRYNSLYRSFRNLNRLLAWAHATALENLLKRVKPELVILDRFSYKEEFQKALKTIGKHTPIHVEERAEEYIPVAAASVVARAEFLNWMRRASRKLGMEIPLGSSSPKVIECGCEIYKKGGEDMLSHFAKLHFSLTNKIKERCGGEGSD